MYMTISLTHYHRLGRPGVDIHCSHGPEVAVIQILFLINEVTPPPSPPPTPPTSSPPFQITDRHKNGKGTQTYLSANLFSKYTIKSEFLNSVCNILCKYGYILYIFFSISTKVIICLLFWMHYICTTCKLLNMIL